MSPLSRSLKQVSSLLWLLVLPAVLILAADKTVKKNSADAKKEAKSGTFTVKVPVDVVVVNAVVTDKQGNPVKDLKVDEFKVYEDGQPQRVHTFALESYKSTQREGSGRLPGTPSKGAEPGSTQNRMISLVVDDLATSDSQFFSYAQEALKKLLTQGIEPTDLVSLTTASGNVNQPFTSDRELLLSLVSELHKKVQRIGTIKSECPELTDLQA